MAKVDTVKVANGDCVRVCRVRPAVGDEHEERWAIKAKLRILLFRGRSDHLYALPLSGSATAELCAAHPHQPEAGEIDGGTGGNEPGEMEEARLQIGL